MRVPGSLCTERCLDGERSSEPGGGDVEIRATIASGDQRPASIELHRSVPVKFMVRGLRCPGRHDSKCCLKFHERWAFHYAQAESVAVMASRIHIRHTSFNGATCLSKSKSKHTSRRHGHCLHIVHKPSWIRVGDHFIGSGRVHQHGWTGQIHGTENSEAVVQISWLFYSFISNR